MASKALPEYKVVVSGVTFQLSEASLQSDSPHTNLLAMSLLGDFAEASDKTLVLSRNAISFALVRDHLNGYTIFPLDPPACAGMDEARLLRYLKDDADYYGLQRLSSTVSEELERVRSIRMEKEQAQAVREAERIKLKQAEIQVAAQIARVKLAESCILLASDRAAKVLVWQEWASKNHHPGGSSAEKEAMVREVWSNMHSGIRDLTLAREMLNAIKDNLGLVSVHDAK